MPRLLSHSAAALAAFVITVSAFAATFAVPGQQVAALLSAPGLA